MPLLIIQGDITRLKCDAIVNAANNSLLGGGGVDGAIHRAAGPKLLEECRKLHGCDTGEAKITSGYNLDAKYVIHTVGPIYRGGMRGERELLESCYKNSLKLASENNCETVAFPMISAGVYGYPFDEALEVAVTTISTFLDNEENDMTVYIVIFSKRDYQISHELFDDVNRFVKDRLIFKAPLRGNIFGAVANKCAGATMYECADASADASVEDYVKTHKDESFSQMLLRLIDEKGMTDVEAYKKANVDRKLFSKIRSNASYHPRKVTVLGFAIALKLTLDETDELLMKAGYALSDSDTGDLVVEYFITNEIYDINQINEVLFAMDQTLIGEYYPA